ncbi:hypothetical protein D3C81_1276840 [compost metagenome]
MALLIRFDSTCLKRKGSSRTSTAGLVGWNANESSSFFCRARPSKIRTTDATSSAGLTRSGLRLRCPDSIRAMSRMSPIRSSKSFAELYATSMAGRSGCCWSMRLRVNSSMPMIAFIGVRISWLIVARNVLLARFASSARSFAHRKSSNSCRRSLISIQPPMMPCTSPRESR